MGSSENVEQSELKCDQISRNLQVSFWLNIDEQIWKIN